MGLPLPIASSTSRDLMVDSWWLEEPAVNVLALYTTSARDWCIVMLTKALPSNIVPPRPMNLFFTISINRSGLIPRFNTSLKYTLYPLWSLSLLLLLLASREVSELNPTLTGLNSIPTMDSISSSLRIPNLIKAFSSFLDIFHSCVRPNTFPRSMILTLYPSLCIATA